GRDDGLIFPAELVQDSDTIMADTERLIGAYHDRSPHAMTRIVAGPSGSSVATPGLMEAAAELAEKPDVRMTTHLSQVAGEEEGSLGYFGKRQVDWLESVGWGSSRAWVAHCIFVTDDEIARLARWGVGVAHCPTTCCLVADGVTPVGEMRRAGVNVGLACDGGGSGHGSVWLGAATRLLPGRLRRG